MIDELSIVIPCLNEEKYLPKLLRSIISQNYTGKLQVIIVDGASTDTTVPVARIFQKQFADLTICTAKRGIGHQRNVGVRKAKYKYLLFLDADMILPAKFLERLLPKIDTHRDFIITVLLFSAEFDILTNLILIVIFYPLAIVIGYQEHFVPGGLILTTKHQHDKIGGFREDFNRAEDTDYGIRSTQAGAYYHIFLFPFAFHSARRVYQMGRVNFFLFHWRSYRYLKRYGREAAVKNFPYPFAHYDK